jgi:putative membrane protein
MMFWYDNDLSGWGWVGMTVGMVLFWGLVITGIVLLVRAISRPDQPSAAPPPADAQQLLAERFARGEIDEPEYRARLATLRGATRPGVRS